MKKLVWAGGVLLILFLAACGSRDPINPAGTWSGTNYGSNGSDPAGSSPATLVITETSQGIYQGVFTEELSGTTFADLNCQVTGSNMVCEVNYGEEGYNAFLEMEGSITATTYKGSLRGSLGGASMATGTFDLSRPDIP